MLEKKTSEEIDAADFFDIILSFKIDRIFTEDKEIMLTNLPEAEITRLFTFLHNCRVSASMWRFFVHPDVLKQHILLPANDITNPVVTLLAPPLLLSCT